MCLLDTKKGIQTQKLLNNPSPIGAPKCRDRNKFPQTGQIAINGNWNSPAKKYQVIYYKCFAGQVGLRRYTRANFMRHYLVSLGTSK